MIPSREINPQSRAGKNWQQLLQSTASGLHKWLDISRPRWAVQGIILGPNLYLGPPLAASTKHPLAYHRCCHSNLSASIASSARW